MNYRHTILMSIAGVAVIALVCSCSKDEPKPKQLFSEPEIEYSIKSDCATKTANSGLGMEWETNDAITVFYPHSGTSEAGVFEYEGENIFTGMIHEPATTGDWYAVYPYMAENTDPTAASVIFDSAPVQVGNDNMAHIEGPCLPLWGRHSGFTKTGDEIPSLPMNQIAAIARFNVINQENSPLVVNRIDFTAPVEISGKFSADLAATEPVWTASAGASKTVILSVTDGTAIAPGDTSAFYIPMMAFNATGDYSISVHGEISGESATSSKTVNMEMDLGAGLIRKINFKFRKAQESEDTNAYYVLLQSDPGAQNWSGTYLITNSDGTKAFAAFSNKANSYSYDVTPLSGNRILSTPAVDKYAFTISGGTTIHPKVSNHYEYDVKNSDGKYIYCSSNSVQISDSRTKSGYPSYTYYHAFDFSQSGIKMTSANTSGNTTYYLRYSNGFSYNSTDSNRVRLYRLSGGQSTTPQPRSQSIIFGENSYTWNIGNEYKTGYTYPMPQSVSGALTPVVYSSSDNTVAEVVSNNFIRIIGTGTTTITANAMETDSYASASASYTLKIREVIDDGFTDAGSFNLENEHIQLFLTDAAATYNDNNWSTTSIATNENKNYYGFGGDGDLYDSSWLTPHSNDKPAPVLLPVSFANNTNVTISVYNNSALTSHEVTVTDAVANGKVRIYNLIPNRNYWCTVTSGNGTVECLKFETEGRRRYIWVSDTIHADHANNFRDLGGMLTTDGKKLKYNVIFRGTNLNELTTSEKNIMIGYLGITRDVDLRKTNDSKERNKPRQVITEIDYTNTSFDGWTDLSNGAKIKEVFTPIISTVGSGGAVYIHCFAGADRTGYICMLIEAVCGVSFTDCTIDYELTSFSCVGIRDRISKVKSSYMKDGLPYLHNYRGNTIKEKAENILLDAGLTSAQIQTLRSALVED